MSKRTHYTQQAHEEFLKALTVYRKALTIGNSADIIAASLWVHRASGDVSRNLRRLVSKAYRETHREDA